MLRPKKTGRAGGPDSTSFWSGHLAWALLCICLIPTSLILALHVPAVQRYLVQEAVHRLETKADVGIQIESVLWSPFRESRLFHLKVKTSGENILECDEAKLRYHLSWRWPYLSPDELLLERPWLRLERDAQGQLQIPRG